MNEVPMVAQRILIVDDDPSACKVLLAILEQEGYQVDVANSGEAALEAVQHRTYDLVILDYQMPGMDGAELCQRIHESKPDLPAIFLTAYATINTVYPAIGAGAERVLAKPVDYRELMPLVVDLIGKP